MIVCAAATMCLLAPASPAAGASRPPVSLVAAPARVTLNRAGHRTILVTNAGSERVVVDVTRAGYGLGLRGRPRIVRRRRTTDAIASWLAFRPRRLSIPPGRSRSITIASNLPRRAEPGDHAGLVLLTTRPRRGGAVAVRIRLGVVVVVRAPGKIVRDLAPLRLRVRRAGRLRVLALIVANRGNVMETLEDGCVTLSLHRRGRLLARLAPAPRQLLPRTRGIAEIRYHGRIRGVVTARVQLSPRKQCGPARARAFRIRL